MDPDASLGINHRVTPLQSGLVHTGLLQGAQMPHLMVPVGEGTGLTRVRRSGSGMWIFSGEMCGYSGRRGDIGASSWGSSDVNWTLMAVLGKRKVHLQGGSVVSAARAGSGGHGCGAVTGSWGGPEGWGQEV